jgi:hypothetical protein
MALKKTNWHWWLLAIIALIILNILLDHYFVQRHY